MAGEQNAQGTLWVPGHLTEALHHKTFKEKIRYAGAKQAWDPQAFCSPADCQYRRSTGLYTKVNAFALAGNRTGGPKLP
jgi:hypothetical protein